MARLTALLTAAAVLLLCVPLHAEMVMNPADDTLWVEDFDTLVTNPNRHDGWGVYDPPQVAMTVKDGVASIAETSERGYAPLQYYV
ncbi:MAG: hypothetical protein ACLFWB_00090, partial [Armatimonadota bacterium]